MEYTYPFPPIREAVFDIATETNVSQEDIEQIHSLIEHKYPIKKKKIIYTSQIVLEETSEINTPEPEFKGYIFSNKEGNKHVQFRIDGFSLNFLPPYTNWKEFYSEALNLWQIYFDNIKPISVNRIALRYINRINIPPNINTFQEYIANIPPIPKCLPQSYLNFFMQIEVPCGDGFNALITETIEKPNKDYLPFILDIDVYKNVENDLNIEDFNHLRKIKNSIFEDFITDKTRKLFEYE